jgi:hypothetical protein
MNLSDILLEHDLWLTRRFLEKAQTLSDAQLDEPLVGIGNPLSFLGEEKTLREMLHRLVFTKELWMNAVHGRQENKNPDKSVGGMLKRLDSAFGEFNALARQVKDENLWDTSFIDMVCEPPQTFTYSGMIAHVVTFSAYRRTAVIEAFEHFGMEDFGAGDPIDWQRAQTK